MTIGLSLVSLAAFSIKDVHRLRDEGIKQVALAPTQISNLGPGGELEINHSLIEALVDAGIKVKCIQGLFYGLDPHLRKSESRFLARSKSIGDLCHRYHVESVVLGAPALRRSPKMWSYAINDGILAHLPQSTCFYIENICLDDCAGVGPFGPRIEEVEGINFTFDLANSLDCKIHRGCESSFGVTFSMVHLSGANHGPVTSAQEVGRLLSPSNDIAGNTNFFWEFSEPNLEAQFTYLNLSRNTLNEKAPDLAHSVGPWFGLVI